MPAPLAHLSFATLWQPIIMVQSAVVQILYLLIVSRIGKRFFRRYQPMEAGRIISFLAGMWVFYFAFGSPFDYVADHLLFSVHMVQHLVEILLLVPLILYGMPSWLISPLVEGRRGAVARRIFHPIVNVVVFNVIFFSFHLPVLYDLALRNESFHFFEHAMFFVGGVFLWMPVFSPFAEIPRLEPGPQVLYMFFAGNLAMPLDILLLFAQHPFYSYYLHVPRMFGLSPLADQQLGFAIMAGAMFIAFFAVAVRAYVRYDNAVLYE